jgi:hypothetical protein
MTMTALFVFALAAQTPAPGVSEYFPLNPGDSWVYQDSGEGGDAVTTDTVGDPIVIKGIKVFPVVSTTDEKESGRVYYKLGEGEVTIVAFKKDQPLSKPYAIVKTPDMGGWRYQGETFMLGAPMDLTLDGRVKKAGTVEFDGKKVEAIEVRLEAKLMEEFGTPWTVIQVATYGKGIGLIRMDSTTKLPRRTEKVTRKLIAYKPKAK